MSNKKLVVILGPTASGKTELAIKLAKKFNGEIVSADSRQVYKEMLIGTASPSAQIPLLRSSGICAVPHYLLHIIPPNQKFNVAIYKKLAIQKIRDIQQRGKLPFLVGGTGLYIQAVVDNIDFPKVAPQSKLRKELEKKSAKQLFEIYQKLDPAGAKLIEKQNKRRLVRAIEVCKTAGKPFSEQRKKGKPLFDALQIGIKLSKQELEKRISQRVNKMIEQGLEQEVKNLVKKYGWVPSLQTIGYQEWLSYFQGTSGRKEVVEKIIIHTLQFAKRQMTWFKRDKRIIWIKTFQASEKLIEDWLCP